MARHIFIVVNDAPSAEEAEAFDTWYVERHMPDVLDVPGVVAAQRYRLAADPAKPDAQPRYAAIYEIETEDRAGVMGEIRRRAGTEQMPLFSGPHRTPVAAFIGEAVTPRMLANKKPD